MGWSSAFVAALRSLTLRPRFLLETVPGSGFDPGPTLALSSHPTSGYRAILGREGSMAGALLQLGSWSCSYTEVTLPLIADIRGDVARGQLLVLRVGWPGWAESDYEPVFYGHVVSLDRSGLGEDWTLTLRSVVAGLTSRMSETDGDASLFQQVTFNTLAGAYVAGAASLTVGSAVAAGAEDTTYLLQVIPSTGDPFFLTATLISDTFFPSPNTGILGTTAVAAEAGDAVWFCALVLDNPVDAVRKILTSTSTGTNGPYDTLPASWGMALPAEILDDDDCDRTRDVVDPEGASPYSDWHVYSTEPQADALSWLQQVLAPAGLVLCERQGRVTVRGVSAASVVGYELEEITDAHIVSIERSSTWDTGSPVEFGGLLVSSPTGSTLTGEEDLASRPAVPYLFTELVYVRDDAADWRASVVERLQPWSTRVPEVVEISTTGLRFAHLAPCDSIRIRSRFWRPRDGELEPTLMVLGVTTDWWNGGVRITAAYHPIDEREF